MGGGGGKIDKNIGRAALASAATGQQALDWMMSQAEITNQWAEEDRARSMEVFRPLEDQYIADAQNWNSAERVTAETNQAMGDVRLAAEQARGIRARDLAAKGISPDSGAAMAGGRADALSETLAGAAASNGTRTRIANEADAKMANVINLGKGLAVNPASSMQLSNTAGAAGFGAAQQGYANQGQLLVQQNELRMQQYQNQQAGLGSLGGALGSVAGAFMSSEEMKTDKTPVYGILDAVKALKTEKWTYKPGRGDGGTHIGPYAEDWQAKTGLGDGQSINVIDALGVSLGSIKELAEEVAAMKKTVGKAGAGKKAAA
jgi:hypothetical protein